MEGLDLKKPAVFAEWQAFLQQNGIEKFDEAELAQINQTLAWRCQTTHELIATVSLADGLIKYLAIAPKFRETGKMFNQVISAAQSKLAEQNHFNSRVVTKPQLVASFEHVGFSLLAKTADAAVMEAGLPNLEFYLANLPQPPQTAKSLGAIVMNANPFTNGHLALVKRASAACDFVYVFVVADDVSLFTTAERTQLIEQNCEPFPNVAVVSGSNYMVSFTTFPAYFTKSNVKSQQVQTKLDATLFKNIAQKLGITRRFVGSEPLSPTTATYNQALKQILPPAVRVDEMPRMKYDNTPISASAVRQFIKAGDVTRIAAIAPEKTVAFIERHLPELQNRLVKKPKLMTHDW